MVNLSRALCDDSSSEDIDSGEIDAAVHVVLKSLPVSEPRLKDLRVAIEDGNQLQQLKDVIRYYT